jgi:hypothetical protein
MRTRPQRHLRACKARAEPGLEVLFPVQPSHADVTILSAIWFWRGTPRRLTWPSLRPSLSPGKRRLIKVRVVALVFLGSEPSLPCIPHGSAVR